MKKTYIIILFLLGLLTLATCHKDKEIEVKSPVISGEEMTVAETQASISWKVDYVGSFQTGVEVSSHEDMSEARRVEATKADDKYVAVVDGLTAGAKYYYRIVVWNKFGSFKEETKELDTQHNTEYRIQVTCQPEEGGSVTGAGTYEEGKYCTLNAIPNQGFVFVNWTENGNQVSANSGYTFKVTQDRTLVAHFALQKYTISVSADPSGGGTVSGDGEYADGQSCTVTATANNGYTFSKWTENGTQVSTDANYTFTVSGDRTLVAHFTELQPDEYNVNVSANPAEGGSVTGGGTYHQGQQCTVTATANNGYAFVNWTENGTQVSTEASYTFTVNDNHTLVANFMANEYTISVSADPSDGGSVSGGGNYQFGDECTITATANEGYTFSKWTENGSAVSTNSIYTFTVNENRNLMAHFTPKSYMIYVSHTGGGSVSGSGSYTYGQSCTVTATASVGHVFANWTEDGNVVSNQAVYTFTVTGTRSLVAHFQDKTYNISVSCNPIEGGTVSGGGHYSYGDLCTLTATANNGFVFSNWTEDGNVISNNPTYVLSVTDDRTLIANFAVVIKGRFSVSESQQVYFSPGNLQFNAMQGSHQCADGTTQQGTWRFAEHQWDYIGNANSNISQNYNGWIDLFGWGMSGWDCGNSYYHPWDWQINNGQFYGPSGSNDLTGSFANSDWGVFNAISNGGNQVGLWRTLTEAERVYLFSTRSTRLGMRFAMAKVNDVNGVILLPDDWNDYYPLYNINSFEASFGSNVISSSVWTNSFEAEGAVFLPAAGYRMMTAVNGLNGIGGYWSASCSNSSDAYDLDFGEGYLNIDHNTSRNYGVSVRLVCPVQ